jgi:hypothetical protein
LTQRKKTEPSQTQTVPPAQPDQAPSEQPHLPEVLLGLTEGNRRRQLQNRRRDRISGCRMDMKAPCFVGIARNDAGLHQDAGIENCDTLPEQSYLSSEPGGRTTLSYVPAFFSIRAMRTMEVWRSLSRFAL